MVIKKKKYHSGLITFETATVELAKIDPETGEIKRHELTEEDHIIFRAGLFAATPQVRIDKLRPLADKVGAGHDALNEAEQFIRENGVRTEGEKKLFALLLDKFLHEIRIAAEEEAVPAILRDDGRQKGASKGGRHPKRLKHLEGYLDSVLAEKPSQTADDIWINLKKNESYKTLELENGTELYIDGERLYQVIDESEKSISKATFKDYVSRRKGELKK